MRDVLFLSYYFPPIGGAGVQRSLKFARYLPAEGFRPLVVAGPAGLTSRWSPRDDALASEVPDDLVVHRAAAAPPTREGARGKLRRLAGRAEPHFAHWARELVRVGREAARAGEPAVVYVSLSPFEGLEPALQLGRELGVRVVADLRDPWALDEVQVAPTLWHRAREQRAMGALLRRADRVLMNTPEALAAARRAFPELPAERLDWLPNGYDASDFEGLAPRAPDGRFRIVHSGYLHTARALAHRRRAGWRRRLGGEVLPTDHLGRTVTYLLEALERIEREDRERARGIDLELVGVLSDADRASVERSSFADRVRLRGYLDHAATVAAQVDADALFLPMHGLPVGARARIVPGKTYEYLAAGRPILAAVPAGDARDFVLAAGAGLAVEPSDVTGLAGAIAALQDAAPTPRREPGDAVARFERRTLTRRLADVFRELLETPRENRAE